MFLSITVLSLVGIVIYRFVQSAIKKSAAKFLYPKRSLASSSPADYGFDYEDVRFYSSDGLTLEGWYLPAQSPEKATIIFVHGLKGNRASLLRQAVHLLEQGYGALLFDLRNHGSSEGHITTMTAKEIFDVEAALAFLKARAEIDPNNIGIIGHSLGASTALRAAARHEFKFVVAQAAFADLCDSMHQAARSLTGLAAHNLLCKGLLHPFVLLMIVYAQKQVGHKAKTISPIRDLATMTPRPCLFIHGLNDKTITASNSQILFDFARGDKELLLLENVGHSVDKLVSHSQASVLAFVENYGYSKNLAANKPLKPHYTSVANTSLVNAPVVTTSSGAYLL